MMLNLRKHVKVFVWHKAWRSWHGYGGDTLKIQRTHSGELNRAFVWEERNALSGIKIYVHPLPTPSIVPCPPHTVYRHTPKLVLQSCKAKDPVRHPTPPTTPSRPKPDARRGRDHRQLGARSQCELKRASLWGGAESTHQPGWSLWLL